MTVACDDFLDNVDDELTVSRRRRRPRRVVMANSSFEHRTAAKLLGDDGGSSRTLPIACRFVPMDQWLFTHIDTSWKIKEIKHWILTKCDAWGDSRGGKQHPQPPRFRPASPVTFAPSRKSSVDSISSKYEAGEDGEGNEEGEEDDDWDVFAYSKELRASEVNLPGSSTTPVERATISRTATRQELSTAYSSMSLSSAFNQDCTSTASIAQKYILFSFSCGHTLEDEASLNWYKLRPFELLELHRVSAIVSLPRRSALAYADPYFESPIRICEGISNKHKARKGAGGVANTAGARGITEDQHSAHSMEWKSRWAIIREGVLNICKDSTTAPTHRFPLASIVAVRGPEQADLSSRTKPRVISIKFRLPNANPGPPEWSPGYSDVNYNTPWHPPDKRKHKHSKSSTWVILDLPTSNSHENILRVLHRLAPNQLQSIFLPAVSLPTKTPHPSPISGIASPSSPSPLGSPPSPASRFGDASPTLNNDHGISIQVGPNFAMGVQYPEWRHALFDRARQAGVGDVGHAMAHYLCGNDNDPAGVQSDLRKQASTIFNSGPSSSFGHAARPSVSSAGSASTATGTWAGTDDEVESDDDEDDDMESLMEWEGWARDVARLAEEQRPPAPAPSSRRSYRDPFMNVDAETSGALRSASRSTNHPTRTLSPSSPSSSSECSAAESHDDFGDVSIGRTLSTRTRALSFAPPPHHLSESSSSSSVGPRRSRSSTVTSTGTITPNAMGLVAAPVPTRAHAVGRSSSIYQTDADPSMAAASHSRPSLRLSLTTNFAPSTQGNVISPSSSSSGARSLFSSGSASSQMNSTPSTSGSSTTSGMGIGNMRRIVRNVSIRNAISAGTDRFAKSLEDALDFVDGRY
ncbi:hypothetical protein SCHPADRAFT_889737 [Schizopora paradoxa]|uniref:Uncharacterized protein n=1 Tax=Schizopora paradoxa TaxID=27342 RepID=A0A0H2RPM1_9AGAM|nr:hypothetical protein SCHPADRAFT_889737 [Schizopora paradoxa]